MERRGRIIQVVAGIAAALSLAYLFARSTPVERAFEPAGSDERFVAGQLLVGFRPDAPAAARAAARRSVGARLIRALPVAGVELLALSRGADPPAIATALERIEAVAFAEPNFLYRAAALPNDARFARQWGLHNLGQRVAGTSGTRDADIDAPAAWTTSTGEGVSIAIVDSGIAYDHPDLKARVDGPGRDWVDDDQDAYDLNGHGTHVAGIAAGSFRDGYGIAGVAPGAGIVALRVLDPAGVGSADDIASAISYAAEIGVRVANVSIAGPASESVLAAIEAAPDLLVVAAAGNSSSDVDLSPVYPCAYPSATVICVGASDSSDDLAGSSNYGTTSVDLVAPGTGILSSSPSLRQVMREDFGSDGNGWTSTGSATWALARDSFGGYLSGTTEAAGGATGPSDRFDLSRARSCGLAATLSADLGPTDLFTVETTTGGTWTSLGGYEGSSSGWKSVRGLLPPVAGLGLRFNLQTTEGGRGDVDDVRLTCIEGGARAFRTRDGTSMAAPFVSGVAALVLEAQPQLTTGELVARILGSVDRRGSLAGRVASGGRVNAGAAVSDQ